MADLNSKYEQLLAKLHKASDKHNEENSETLNRDDRLKQLYDKSLDFKNMLAQSRQTLKQIENQTLSFSARCDDFEVQLRLLQD